MTDTKNLTDEELKQVSGGFGNENGSNISAGDFCELIYEKSQGFDPKDFTHGTDKTYMVNFIYGNMANVECYEGIWESIGVMKEYTNITHHCYGEVELSKLRKIDKPKWVQY